MYTIIVSDAVRKQLHTFEKHTAQRIIGTLERSGYDHTSTYNASSAHPTTDHVSETTAQS